jgi:oligoendopeptidase F
MKKMTTQWNLSALGKKYDDPAFLVDRDLTEKKYKDFHKKWSKDKSFLTDPCELKKALDEFNILSELGTKENVYLWLTSQVDSQNKTIIAALKKYADFSNKISDWIRFFFLELGTIDKKSQTEFLKNHLLVDYKNVLKNIFAKSAYKLSEKEEKIISMKFGVAHDNWNSMLSEFLYKEERETFVEKNINSKNKIIKESRGLNELFTLTKSKKKKVRLGAWLNVLNIIKKHKDVAEKEINSILENKKIDDILRGYKRPDSSRHISEGIDTNVVDTLCDVVGKNWKLSHNFYKLKSKLLKQDTFKYYERNLGYGKMEKEYTYPEAIELVSKGFARIDKGFVKILDDFVYNGNIDVYPKKGKRGGAFCLHNGVKDPVYIMLNHDSEYRKVATLAHEMGHAIHAIYGKSEKQLNYNVPMCTAEVASTFCEDFVFEELMQTDSDDEKLILMMERLENKTATIFRQIAAYNFEKEIHKEFREKGYLSNHQIGNIFNKNMKSYLGPKFTMDDDSGLCWIYWNHFRSPFYVYSYAMGLLCAQAMQSEFKSNPEFISSIKEFYSTRSSLSPIEIFTKMGMDITQGKFWQKGIDEYKVLLQEATFLAKKLGKI